MKDYRNLRVWHKAHVLALNVYQVTEQYPKKEMFGLTSQMRRAAVSIASNIAEGYGRSSEKDFLRFLQMASGPACELECQLLLSRDLAYIKQKGSDEILSSCEEVRKMLAGIIRKISSGGWRQETGS